MLICKECGSSESYVKNSRNSNVKKTTYLRRRRECAVCGNRFCTVEVTMEEYSNLLKGLNIDDKIIKCYFK